MVHPRISFCFNQSNFVIRDIEQRSSVLWVKCVVLLTLQGVRIVYVITVYRMSETAHNSLVLEP